MNKATVGEWFRNPYPFAGCIVWNTRDHRLRPKPRAEWVMVEHAYPSIINMDVAEKIYQKAEQRKIGRQRWANVRKYLLTGLLKCNKCGANFVVTGSKKQKQAYYICGSRSRRRNGCSNKLHLDTEYLKEQLTQWVHKTILEPGFVEGYFEHILQSSEDEAQHREQEITRLEVELLKVEARLDELVDVLADRTLPRDVVTKKLRAEQNRKEQIETEITQHKVSIPALPPPLDSFREELSQALEDPETKKAAIDGLIRKITVHSNATLKVEYAIKLASHDIALQRYQSCANLRERLENLCNFLVFCAIT